MLSSLNVRELHIEKKEKRKSFTMASTPSKHDKFHQKSPKLDVREPQFLLTSVLSRNLRICIFIRVCNRAENCQKLLLNFTKNFLPELQLWFFRVLCGFLVDLAWESWEDWPPLRGLPTDADPDSADYPTDYSADYPADYSADYPTDYSADYPTDYLQGLP